MFPNTNQNVKAKNNVSRYSDDNMSDSEFSSGSGRESDKEQNNKFDDDYNDDAYSLVSKSHTETLENLNVEKLKRRKILIEVRENLNDGTKPTINKDYAFSPLIHLVFDLEAKKNKIESVLSKSERECFKNRGKYYLELTFRYLQIKDFDKSRDFGTSAFTIFNQNWINNEKPKVSLIIETQFVAELLLFSIPNVNPKTIYSKLVVDIAKLINNPRMRTQDKISAYLDAKALDFNISKDYSFYHTFNLLMTLSHILGNFELFILMRTIGEFMATKFPSVLNTIRDVSTELGKHKFLSKE